MALKKEREFELGLIIKDYRESTEEEQKEKFPRAYEAFLELFEHNQNFAYNWAHRFVKKTNSFHYNIEDACQDALLALTKAIWRYDPTKGARVTTFSNFYIFKALTHEGNLQRHIQINDGVAGKYLQMKEVIDEYNKLENPTMTQREYVQEKTGFKLDLIIDLENLSLVPSSLQHEIDDDGGGSHKVKLQDVLADERTSGARFSSGFTVETEGLLEMLPHEEQLYLRYQYGDQTLTKPFDEFLQERDLTPRKFTRQANLIVKKLRDLVKKEGVSISAT